MRKQYYFRPSKNGFYAWDVDELVKLSQVLPIIDRDRRKRKERDEQRKENGKLATYRSIAEHMKLVEETDLKYVIAL